MKSIRPLLLAAALLPVFLPSITRAEAAPQGDSSLQKNYFLWDDQPAPLDLKGWEYNSYPLGNGHFGVSFFGGVGEELWQFTDKALYVGNPKTDEKVWNSFSLSSLLEIRLFQDQALDQASNYRREVNLNKAIGGVRYTIDGVEFQREHLASYPDNVFASRLTASKPGQVSFRLKALHPYLSQFRSGQAKVDGDTLVLDGEALPYHFKYQVRVAVKTQGGRVRASAEGAEGEFVVEGADSAEVYVTLGDNYRLESQVFLNPPETKLEGFEVPTQAIEQRLASALAVGWDAVRQRHEADYTALFRSALIDLGGEEPAMPTRQLLATADLPAPAARYLEELYFQFGRYLLIASSRPGTLPANLQGTWNMHNRAPWTGGFWANINLQMNYWPAFVTGLAETFEPYYNFWRASFPQGQKIADNTLVSWKRPPAEGGWTAGTGNTPYRVLGPDNSSGAGTGPFVILPMWEWYRHTGDKAVLEKVWPFLIASSRFLASAVKEQPDGTLLCDPSWSPEIKGKDGDYLNLPGTAYDQQLVYENYRMTLEAAKTLGKDDPMLATIEAQLPKLSPVLIGASGQIKEFRQESVHGEFGHPKHRHISQLITLFPGTLLTEKKEWLDAARTTLNLRGDKGTGWATAHRLNAWTRVKDGDRCHSLLRILLAEYTMPNLWDAHPPFQIDGNFGGAAGIANMLLQSHEGFIDLLPALPKAWNTGSFAGLRAFGGFSVAAQWKDSRLEKVTVFSKNGGPCRLKAHGAAAKSVTDSKGGPISFTSEPDDARIEFETQPGASYQLSFDVK